MGGVAAAAAVDSLVTGGAEVPPRADSRTSSHQLLVYLSSRELMVPVDGVRVAAVPDNFSAGRGGRAHNAHDIMAPRGTPVLAADDGRVIRLANNALGGLTIYATDPDERLVYYYAHLDGYEAGLKAGARIRKGDVIGFVGSTGNASPSAPHLHFQVARLTDMDRHWDGIPVDAREYLVLDGKRR
jgi:murein DD-endopeptidase MepM/ murein hydrolase activator NlpD